MGKNKSRINHYVVAIVTCLNAVLFSALVVIPHPIFAMGTSYEDCSGHNLKEINRVATQSLQLTKKIQYESRKYPTRLRKTITAVDKIEKDLNRVKSMTASRSKNTDIVVRSEINRFVGEGNAQMKEFDNVMELLFNVFRESIQEQNADKQYWLNKLAEMNEIGDALSDYMRQLNDAVREIKEQCDEPKQPYKPQLQEQVPVKPSIGR